MEGGGRRGQGRIFFLEFDTFFNIQFKNTFNLIFPGFKVPSESFLFKNFKTGLTFFKFYSEVVNISVGHPVYGFFDKKFRRIFKKMICPCIKPEPATFHSSRESTRKLSLMRSVSLTNNPLIVTSPTFNS